MTSPPAEGWKNFEEGDETENVPLWHVVAQLKSKDLDEGLKANTAFINKIKPHFGGAYNFAFFVSFVFGFIFFILFIGFLTSARSGTAVFFFYPTLIAAACTVAPHLWRQAYQYGLTIPDAPLQLPHASNEIFDEVLGYLQRVDGPKAYYLSRFRKKRVRLKRRQFFGKLRYFLFSEHSRDRGIVMRFPTAMSLPADLYLHRDDVKKMLAKRYANPEPEPKRKGGNGVLSKYPYEDAIVSALSSEEIKSFDLTDRDATVIGVAKMLVAWFKEFSDERSDAPRADYPRVKQSAEKIYAILKNLSQK